MPTRFRWLLVRGGLFGTLFLSLLLFSPTAAQIPASAYYWEYPFQTQKLQTTDMNLDGLDEFLLSNNSGKITLLGADGRLLWEYSAPSPILTFHTLRLNNRQQLGIALATTRWLILLSDNGQELWRTAINAVPIPSALLTEQGAEVEENWQNSYMVSPIALQPLAATQEGQDDIVLLLASGQVRSYTTTGTLRWLYVQNSIPALNPEAKMVIGDINQDGREEIVVGHRFTLRRFSEVVVLNNNGVLIGGRPLEGRISALTLVQFDAIPTTPAQTYLAIGTSAGQVSLYNRDYQRVWLRTLNKPITALIPVQLPSGRALAVGTSVGVVTTFSENGRRYWTSELSPNANRAILSLSAVPTATTPQLNRPVLAALLGTQDNSGIRADIVLLGGQNGQTLKTLPNNDNTGLSRLLDINHDEHPELLVAQTNRVGLLGIGLGSSNNALDWQYDLGARPRAFLVLDSDLNGEEELLVGGSDGRLHLLDNNGRHIWVTPPGGTISQLLRLPPLEENQAPDILILRQITHIIHDSQSQTESVLTRQSLNGDIIWKQTLPETITSLALADLDQNEQPEIIMGSQDSQLLVYNTNGQLQWRVALPPPPTTETNPNIEPPERDSSSQAIEHILVLPATITHAAQIMAATPHDLYRVYRLPAQTILSNLIASYNSAVVGLYSTSQSSANLAAVLMVVLSDGTTHGFTWRGIELPSWPFLLGAIPTAILPIQDSITEAFDKSPPLTAVNNTFLVASNTGQLLRLDVQNNEPNIAWRLSGQGRISTLYWGDLDGDTFPDLAVANQTGQIRLFNRDLSSLGSDLNLATPIAALTALHRETSKQSDLVAITQDGAVELFRAQENRPPLLTNPTTEVAAGQYSIYVSVNDVEGDPVEVRLEFFDPQGQTWVVQSPKQSIIGSGQLFWASVSPFLSATGVRYRFHYDDGFYQGDMEPTLGPIAILPPKNNNLSFAVRLVTGVVGLFSMVLLLRQWQSPAVRARRFYRQMGQEPQNSLVALENQYAILAGSPDFLLHLASQARQANDGFVAGLADALFLLTDQPEAGLAILMGVLHEAQARRRNREGLVRWRMTYETGLSLLSAPSITELNLLRPSLLQLLQLFDEWNYRVPTLNLLVPILQNLRDSERVEAVDDRLVYLNEAAILIQQLLGQLSDFSPRIERVMVEAILRRWVGLVTAEIEDLRGRADLGVHLKTKRLVPAEVLEVTFEVLNQGRAAAENVTAVLGPSTAYTAQSPPQHIPILPPGRPRAITVRLTPQVADEFRVVLHLRYDDRNQQGKETAFGDMVHLLPPVRDFKPIRNPYTPGTPLRPNNPLFVGRQSLFEFIAENAGQLSQRNILILIGQRRTGKTSVLLRLGTYLPKHIIPIYIDCQSLGVTPGMAALWYDLAWLMADGLALRGLQVEVPPLSSWQENPNGRFQRDFLTAVRAIMPPDTTLLLVFDEFEAFENLVQDGILPPTIFPYLRHLMQHSENLSFIFAGTRQLEEMSADYWSVLFNMALYHKIGYLDAESARQLIGVPVAPHLVYDDLALDKILRVTAGHPYFLQLVCYTLVKRANAQGTGYITISDVNGALDEMLKLGEVHFAYLWQRSSYTERAILTAVAHLLDPDQPFHPTDPVQQLEQYGIQLNAVDTITALNSLVERDILQETTEQATTLYTLKIGLVGLWISQNKSLSKLYASNEEPTSSLIKRKSEPPSK